MASVSPPRVSSTQARSQARRPWGPHPRAHPSPASPAPACGLPLGSGPVPPSQRPRALPLEAARESRAQVTPRLAVSRVRRAMLVPWRTGGRGAGEAGATGTGVAGGRCGLPCCGRGPLAAGKRGLGKWWGPLPERAAHRADGADTKSAVLPEAVVYEVGREARGCLLRLPG